MKSISWNWWSSLACAILLGIGAGAGVACAQPPEAAQEAAQEAGEEAPAATVCGTSSLVRAQITVSGSAGSYSVAVSPDPIALCYNGDPGAVQWQLNDQTRKVTKWDIQANAEKPCASGGTNETGSVQAAELGSSWFGNRSGSPADGSCWVYDVIVQVDGETVVLDPEIDWGR